jgi:hypothetical protein
MAFVSLLAITAICSCNKDDDENKNDSVPVEVTRVTLNKTTLTLVVDSSETLTATVDPDNASDKTVTWTTSNAAKVTVTNGIVTAVAAGSAKIIATAGSKSDTCEVTVIVGTVSPKTYLPKRIYGTAEKEDKLDGTVTEIEWSISFEYDTQDRLTKAIIPHKEYRMDFSYPENEVYRLNYVDLEHNSIYRTVSAIRNGNTITETMTDVPSYSYTNTLTLINEKLARYDNNVYSYDDAGNLIRMEEDNEYGYEYVLTYKYDNKKGIFSNIKTPGWLLDDLDVDYVEFFAFNVNNVTELNFSDSGKGNREYTYEYEYNEDNFPISFQYTETDKDNGDEESYLVFIEYY